MPDQEVGTVVKKDFWKKFRVGFRNFGKMTVDAAVQNRSVVIEVCHGISFFKSMMELGLMCWWCAACLHGV